MTSYFEQDRRELRIMMDRFNALYREHEELKRRLAEMGAEREILLATIRDMAQTFGAIRDKVRDLKSLGDANPGAPSRNSPE
jgi:SMC interacting uncharacterized protein involved in chromosome segregation